MSYRFNYDVRLVNRDSKYFNFINVSAQKVGRVMETIKSRSENIKEIKSYYNIDFIRQVSAGNRAELQQGIRHKM